MYDTYNYNICAINNISISYLADKENIEGYAREKLNKKFFQIMLGKYKIV
jgi:hypothetical protein